MLRLSITEAWNETALLVRKDVGPFFLIAFGLVALPGVAFQFFEPADAAGQPRTDSPFALLIFPVLAIVVIGLLTLTTLALGHRNIVGEAIAHAARRCLALFGAMLLFSIAFTIVLLPVAAFAMTHWRAEPGLVMLLGFLLLVLVFAVWTKMLLLAPVAAAEAGGPLRIIRRSWSLTEGHFWKLLGFLLLMTLVLAVVTGALTAVGVVIVVFLGQPTPGSLSSLLVLLLGGIVNAAFCMVLSVLTARIYVQLVGNAASAAQVFE